MAKVRRLVEMPRGKPGRGGHPRLAAYGYPELAALTGLSEAALRQHAARGAFVFADLGSVLRFTARVAPWVLAGEPPPQRPRARRRDHGVKRRAGRQPA